MNTFDGPAPLLSVHVSGFDVLTPYMVHRIVRSLTKSKIVQEDHT